MQLGVPWIFWTGTGVLALGVIVAVHALLGDWFRSRRHGRPRRCRRCWYDMTGAAGLTCPECGKTARSEAGLLRTRRRWWTGLFGIILTALGLVGVMNQRISTIDWISRAPSFVLVRLLEDPSRPVSNFTYNARGNPVRAASTRTARQQAIYDELLRRYPVQRLSVGDRAVLAKKQFDGLPPFDVHTRAQWPVGVPVRVTVTGRFGGLMPRELRATPDIPSGQTVVAYDGGVELTASKWSPDYWDARPPCEPGQQCIGTPPAGTTEVIFRTNICEGGEMIWQGEVAQKIVVSGTINDILRPVETRAVLALVTTAANGSLRLSPDASQIVINRPFGPALDNVTMGVVVEFLQGETVAASAVFLWRNVPATAESRQLNQVRRTMTRSSGEYVDRTMECWATLSGDVEAVRAANPADRTWRVRVRGDGATTLEDYDATAYWSGTFDVPLETVKGQPRP